LVKKVIPGSLENQGFRGSGVTFFTFFHRRKKSLEALILLG